MAAMHRFRTNRARRAPALIAALALFLLGTNYCVLAGLAGDTRMACLTVTTDASSVAVPACHRAAPAKGAHSEKPAARSSCCPHPVVAPASPVIEKWDAGFAPLADAILAGAIAFASPTAVDSHGHRPAPDGQPPPRFARAPAPARAPPLA